MRSRVIFNSRYTRSIEKAKANVGYIGFRSREKDEDTRGFFDRDHNLGANYRGYIDKLENSPALKHPMTVKVHTMLVSLRQKDYELLKDSGGDLRDVARDVMKDLGERKGLELTWIGALHEKSGHPHVHLNVLAIGKDGDGQQHRLYLDKEDIQWMRDQTLERFYDQVPFLAATEHLSDSMHAARQVSHVMDRMSGGESKLKMRRKRRRYQTRQAQQQQQSGQDMGHEMD